MTERKARAKARATTKARATAGPSTAQAALRLASLRMTALEERAFMQTTRLRRVVLAYLRFEEATN
ncbi:MAG TPA: hypothetical protein VL346_01420 [Acidobacteriaceae bacterium]|nr:hypothetical protein [Acidobacteriaceae bacterium]